MRTEAVQLILAQITSRERGFSVKRFDELKPLSREHNVALLIARSALRAGRSGEAEAVGTMWGKIARTFETDMVPHFQHEERVILPVLQELGLDTLANRLLEDHAQLRALASEGDHGSSAELVRFASLLERHVRFEERIVFNIVQTALDPHQLRERMSAAARDAEGQKRGV